MVYVVQNSLAITPVDPYDSESLTATVWIRGDTFNVWCDDFGGAWTKTEIYLLRRNVTAGQTWATAETVATYDCTGQCCLDIHTLAWAPDGNQGWLIQFDTLNPLHVTAGNTTTYEFLAVDKGDLATKDATRTAKKTVIVARDPFCINNPCDASCPLNCAVCPSDSRCTSICTATPCAEGCPNYTNCTVCPSYPGCSTPGCESGDYICQIIDFAKKNPIVVVGVVVGAYLLLSPPRRSKS
jgi:hypothetical protein